MMEVGSRVQAKSGAFAGYKGKVVGKPSFRVRIVRFTSKRGDNIERMVDISKLREVKF